MADTRERQEKGKSTGRRAAAKRTTGPRAKVVDGLVKVGTDSAGDGAKALRKAAGRAVGRNSRKIAKMLVDKAIAGDVNSAKLLVQLAEKEQHDGPAMDAPIRSVAMDLANDPEWVEDDPTHR